MPNRHDTNAVSREALVAIQAAPAFQRLTHWGKQHRFKECRRLLLEGTDVEVVRKEAVRRGAILLHREAEGGRVSGRDYA